MLKEKEDKNTENNAPVDVPVVEDENEQSFYIKDLQNQIGKLNEDLNRRNLSLFSYKIKVEELEKDFNRVKRNFNTELEAGVDLAEIKKLKSMMNILDFASLSDVYIKDDLEQKDLLALIRSVDTMIKDFMTRENIEPVLAFEDDEFDPLIHTAATIQDISNVSKKIQSLVQCGYKYKGKLIRHATVLLK